jgi:hypothetical protein
LSLVVEVEEGALEQEDTEDIWYHTEDIWYLDAYDIGHRLVRVRRDFSGLNSAVNRHLLVQQVSTRRKSHQSTVATKKPPICSYLSYGVVTYNSIVRWKICYDSLYFQGGINSKVRTLMVSVVTAYIRCIGSSR